MKLGKLTTVGMSAGVVIPRPYLALLGWMKGDYIVQEVRGEELVLRNANPHKVSITHTRQEYGTGRRRGR